MVSLFLLCCQIGNKFSGLYTAMYLTGACKNSRVYKYPLGSSGSVFMASKKYPLPILKYIVKKITI